MQSNNHHNNYKYYYNYYNHHHKHNYQYIIHKVKQYVRMINARRSLLRAREMLTKRLFLEN